MAFSQWWVQSPQTLLIHFTRIVTHFRCHSWRHGSRKRWVESFVISSFFFFLSFVCDTVNHKFWSDCRQWFRSGQLTITWSSYLIMRIFFLCVSAPFHLFFHFPASASCQHTDVQFNHIKFLLLLTHFFFRSLWQVLTPSSGFLDFAISMRPQYHQAIIDTIRWYGWDKIIYLYDSHDGE